MEDAELADELISRLNKLIEDPVVRNDVGLVVDLHIPVSGVTCAHPTIQVALRGDNEGVLGFVGLLNGAVGVDPTLTGALKGYGYISAEFDDRDQLLCFRRTAAGKKDWPSAPEPKPITVGDLPDLLPMLGPSPFLYCEECGEHNSAHSGDYWDWPADKVFMCCDMPMRLVIEERQLKDWRKPDAKSEAAPAAKS